MTLHIDHHDRVIVLTIDRPDRRNAVDHTVLCELLDAQEQIRSGAPDEVRAVVLTGSPPAFCAGADLTGVEQGDFARDLSAVLRGFGTLPVAVIAAIDGPALGAGAQLAVAVDLRVATPESVVGVPAARLGLVVDHWTVRRLANELTPPVARGMLLAAETYTGDRLHQLGAVHRLGSLHVALDWAHNIAAMAPLTISGHKLGLERSAPEPDVDDLYQAAFEAGWASDDAAEGRAAFLEKRPPNFTGE